MASLRELQRRRPELLGASFKVNLRFEAELFAPEVPERFNELLDEERGH